MAEAVRGGHISGNGPFTKRAELKLAEISGSPHALLTTSCTHALELSARILKLGPGDEVIVPAYTFVSTASAFAISGARPIFVDVDPLTFNLDVERVEAAISPKTAAVCTVHYAGIANDIDRLSLICRQRGIPLIEDNAHGFGAMFGEKKLGTFGTMSALSFHETKNVSCGEGGALTINDGELLSRAEILREKGTDRAKFLRGQVDKYTWVEVGSSWVVSDLLAAYLLAQIEKFAEIQTRRMNIWKSYNEAFEGMAEQAGIRTPFVPTLARHSAHMYYLQFQTADQRSHFIDFMATRSIMTVFHYQALNQSRAGVALGADPHACPVASNAADTLVRLPLFADLKSEELARVIEAVSDFMVEQC